MCWLLGGEIYWMASRTTIWSIFAVKLGEINPWSLVFSLRACHTEVPMCYFHMLSLALCFIVLITC